MKFCYCTLAIGEYYHQLAKIFLKSFVEHTNETCVVVTDQQPRLFNSDQVIQIHTKNHGGRAIGLKWLSYYHSLKLGYDTMCFIDVDSVVSEKYDATAIRDVIHDGFGCNWYIRYNENFESKRRGSVKLRALVNDQDTYPIICPVECFMMLSGDVNRSVAFVNEWSRLQQQITAERLYHREVCHEIGLAAKRVNLPIYKYTGGRTTYVNNFKHYGSPGGKREMIKQNEQ